MMRSALLNAVVVLPATLCGACSCATSIATKTTFPRSLSHDCVVEALLQDEAVLDARAVKDEILVELKRPAVSSAEDHHARARVRLTRWHHGRTTVRVEVTFFNYGPSGLECEEWKLLVARLRYRIAAHCGYALEPEPPQ